LNPIHHDYELSHFVFRRRMFFSSWGTTPGIENATMAGNQRYALVSTDVRWPNGLTLDPEESMLYWADAYL
jgi:low density lipoprotein-related protein 2